MKSHSVTFETNCYEGDWKILLKTNRLEEMISRNCFDFSERLLYINNVSDVEQVKFYAEKLKNRNVISDYFVVEDFADDAMNFFQLDRQKLSTGYYYSIQMWSPFIVVRATICSISPVTAFWMARLSG